MLEAIRIRSQGYAVRIAMEEFLNRYTPILCKTKQELDQITMKDKCEAILAKSVPPSKYASQKDIYQIGITKVFMKENARILLE
jgi:myosin heavy subunit